MERLTYGETWNSRDKGGRPESAGIFQFRAAYLAAVDLPKKCRPNIITDKRLAMDEAVLLEINSERNLSSAAIYPIATKISRKHRRSPVQIVVHPCSPSPSINYNLPLVRPVALVKMPTDYFYALVRSFLALRVCLRLDGGGR